MSPTWPTELLPRLLSQWAQADNNTRMAAAMLVVAAVLAFAMRVPTDKSQQRAEKVERPLRVRRQPWHRRFRLWIASAGRQPFYWKIGKHVASLDQTHGLVVGGTGSGKSTLVVSLILQPSISVGMWLRRALRFWRRRPVVIVSFDRSDPIEKATNVLEDRGVAVERWRVRQSNGWNLLAGDVEMIAEALPCGWPTGDNTGFFQQLATDAVSAALHEQDAEGVDRDFDDMIERMDAIMAADPETPELARRTWVRRFRSLARVMGESIGTDFDLASALKPGAVIHISSNSYTNPALTPLVGAMAITQIKMAADKVGGVYLVMEEARFLKKRADLLDDLATSIRARGWRIAYLNQDPCAVGEALQVNFGVAVFMGLGPLAQKARQWCADAVKGFPGAFRAEELVLGATIDQLEGYVLLNGRCRDVSLAPYITRAAEHRPARGRNAVSVADPIVAKGTDAASGHGYQVVEIIDVEHEERLALPPPSTTMQKLLKSIYPEGDCERWGGKHDDRGYGLVWVDGRWQKVHRLRWELAYGVIPLNEDGTKLTLDHLSGVCANKDCSKLTHLEICTRAENVKRRWRVRGAGTGSLA